MFSLIHIITLLICSASIVYFSIVYGNKDYVFTMKSLKIMSVIIILLNPLNWAYEIFSVGVVDINLNLPIHLCSLYWYLFPFAVFLKKDSFFRQICLASCATIGIIGGILGLLMNQHLNLNPFLSFPVLRSIAYHYIMVFSAVLLWTKRVYVPRKADRFTNYIPVLILVLICCAVDGLYGIEYCYVRDGAGTPFSIISSIMPRTLYVITLYLTLYLIIRFVFYNKYIFSWSNNTITQSN